MEKLKVAVVVAHHSYEVCPFQDLFESFGEIHPYIQHVEQFASSSQDVRDSYDVIVFYTMWQDTPINDGPWYEGAMHDAFAALGQTKQGIVMLHHTLLAFPDWPRWAEITAYDPKKYTDYALDVPMHYHNAAPTHPIMQGIPDFDMIDEAYASAGMEDTDVEILLTTDHPQNIPAVAWTTQYKNSKVFCYQSGHNSTSYTHPQFREILRRGILWSADKL